MGRNIAGVDWQVINPNNENVWLTEGLHSEFDEFLPLGTKEAKKAKEADGVVFKTYSLGVATNRDAWAYNFNQEMLADNMQRTIDSYNEQVDKWVKRDNRDAEVDDFVLYDDNRISWSRDLKLKLKRGKSVEFNADKIISSLYRPFTKLNLFFDFVLVDVPGQFPKFFPTPTTENENRVICVSDKGYRANYSVLMVNIIPELHLCASIDAVQSFPLYTYDEDGTNRTDNITEWTVKHYQKHYKDKKITKWAIFHYVYGLLHHPSYREKYASNLKRELSRLPLAPDFWAFSKSGEKLADLHLNYEVQAPYPLKLIENSKVPFSLKVDKMGLSKDKRQLKYNDFLTLDGIPERVFDYKL
ncbi:MAG: type ISP restriction/modification enzyme, partial [Candidatus Parabeggiatoa sp.]|nr:type ISP restriction/modification enzyme [Candidatus Parabeggiatoa sp.]